MGDHLAKRASFVAALTTLLLSPFEAGACPVCLGTANDTPSIVRQIGNASTVVVARATQSPRKFRIVGILKGSSRVPDEVQIAAVDMPSSSFAPGSLVALGRHPLLTNWTPIAEVSEEHVDWLKRLAAMKRESELDKEGWRARARNFAAELFDPAPLVSGNARREIAAAPYDAIRSLAGRIEPARIMAELARPESGPDAALYLVLLGASADSSAATYIKERARSIRSLPERDAAALFTAWLEIDTPTALEFAGRMLRETTTPTSLVIALFTGLRTQGDLPDKRDRIVDFYRGLIADAPMRVGYIANDLQAWRVWALAPRVADVAGSPGVDESARLLAGVYVRAARDGQPVETRTQ